MYLPGATDADLPEALNDYGDACVPWNNDKIQAALDGDNIWEYSSENQDLRSVQEVHVRRRIIETI